MFKSTIQVEPASPPKEPIIAAILSLLFWGGVGQIWLGQSKKGILLIVPALILDFFYIGLFLHVVGAIDAYQMATKLKGGAAVGDMEWFWQK